MKYEVKERKLLVNEYFKVEKVSVSFQKHESKQQLLATRFNLIRGKAVSALIYHRQKQAILLVKQFRFSTAEAGHPWTLELPAGLTEKNENPINAMKRELLEETGFQVNDLRLINRFFVAPGCTDEEILLYYGEVAESDKISIGGGVEGEHEDIELVLLPVSELRDQIIRGKTIDAKSIIGFYWFLENIPFE